MKRIDIIKNIMVFLTQNITKLMCIFPLKDNRIFFSSYNGKQYSCSPKYIMEYLLEKYPSKFNMVFEIKEPKAFQVKGVKFVKSLSVGMLYYFYTSKVIVVNSGMPSYLYKRKGQYLINTWHGGGAYKKCAAGAGNPSKQERRRYSYKGKCTNLVLSSCQRFSMEEVPDIVYGYSGEIMGCGLPRNDIFFSDIFEVKNMICTLFGIPRQKKIILYAPTFRGKWDGLKNGAAVSRYESSLDIESVCEAAAEHFKSDVVFMFRMHHSLKASNIPDSYIDVSQYPDMQELLCAADVLISDYSSTIWDFSLTKKPCFLYVPDMDNYLSNDRGTYTPIEEWPGIICRSNQELQKAIREFDEESYIQKVEKHHRDMGSYENGTACEQVCRRIIEVCEGRRTTL